MNLQSYFEIKNGTAPIILSCPHGGFLKPKSIPDKLKGIKIADKNKYLISKRIIKILKENYGVEIYYILSKIHRSKIDFNRPPRTFSAFNHNSIEAKVIHNTYHIYIKRFYQECVKNFNRCLFIDLHGFTKPHIDYPDIIFGNVFGNTLTLVRDSKAKPSKVFWGFSDIINELSKHFTLDDGLGLSDFNLSFSGGYITHQFYKKSKVNAFQLEVAKYIRENINLTKKFIVALILGIMHCLKI
ncbi:MAG: hypothetical protein ACFFAN_17680 [Promethearchaeota archaeon]